MIDKNNISFVKKTYDADNDITTILFDITENFSKQFFVPETFSGGGIIALEIDGTELLVSNVMLIDISPKNPNEKWKGEREILLPLNEVKELVEMAKENEREKTMMEIELQGSIQTPNLTEISNLKDLKELYSNIILGMVDNLRWRDTDESFEEETYYKIEDYLKNLRKNNPDIKYSFMDNVCEKVRDFCVDSLWNQNEDVIKNISFHEYYEDNIRAGYDFYITIDVDMDKIVEQAKEEAKEEMDIER